MQRYKYANPNALIKKCIGTFKSFKNWNDRKYNLDTRGDFHTNAYFLIFQKRQTNWFLGIYHERGVAASLH